MPLTDYDLYLFGEGTHTRIYEKLGAHLETVDGTTGVRFAVWAPNARQVSVVGDFNGWSAGSHQLRSRGNSGVWELFVPGMGAGELYKYALVSNAGEHRVQKADPYAFEFERPPRTASLVTNLDDYQWGDSEWMASRGRRNAHDAPISIYEVHLGSWMRAAGRGYLTYREAADRLAEHCRDLGFTHVELLPITEHPFDGSWGYQPTGYFAPTSRFGKPAEFMAFIDHLHRSGIGVILDWVPAHFPSDEHGLGFFDGTHLYEHADPRLGKHRDWDTLIFNYSRHEVRNFLLGSGLFWLDRYHVDGLRVDAVASMLYLDYSRKEGEWLPNEYGGNENLAAISFLKTFNERVYAEFPGVMTIAEESTAWPMVSRPTYLGGLGFGFKWNMGWMHDVLEYISKDPIHRTYHHDKLTFGLLYAFTENFILPFSHDEVVHGKGSMCSKMPGDEWQQFANLRALYGFMWTHPGKKLLFMGQEFGQRAEWNHDQSLEWWVTKFPLHAGVQTLLRDLNRIYRAEPALHQVDFSHRGFEWIDANDREQSAIAFLRRAADPSDHLVIAVNFTPVPRRLYRIGVPEFTSYRELINTDSAVYGGSDAGNLGRVHAQAIPFHGRPASLSLTLPPLAALILKPEPAADLQPGEHSR